MDLFILTLGLNLVIRIPFILRSLLQYFFTLFIVLLSCSIPLTANIPGVVGIRTSSEAVIAFIVRIPKLGGVSIII